jgi:hypothetical protein
MDHYRGNVCALQKLLAHADVIAFEGRWGNTLSTDKGRINGQKCLWRYAKEGLIKRRCVS